MMDRKPAYEELEQRIKELESEVDHGKQALRDCEERLKVLSEASFEAIFFSEKSVCLDQNRTAERMFGYTHTEAVGRHATEWIIPEDRERIKNKILSGYEKPYELTALRKDGTTFSCEIQSRMMDCQGRPLRITAVRDITGHKKALAEKTTLLNNILKNAQDIAIATTDLDLRINYYNPMAENLYGYTVEEVLGKTVQEMHTKEKVDPERFERAVEIVRREGRYCYSV
ncbi:MAG: PAS domain S-box protein, partial [Desulfosarcina sp.]|nr:PAS domain S-box protein [Desulfobacterales bacterium]